MKRIAYSSLTLIGSYLVGVASNMTSDRTQNVPVLKYVMAFFLWFYNLVNMVLNYPIKLWIILIVMLSCWGIYRLVVKNYQIVPKSVSQLLDYTQVTIKDWTWKWAYVKNANQQYEISDLTPFCPDCDVQLRRDFSYQQARCPNCNRQWDKNNVYIQYDPDTGRVGRGAWEDDDDIRLIISARASKILKGDDSL